MQDFAVRGATPDKSFPKFQVKAVEIPFKSKELGRPFFEDREFVEIITPGMPKSMAFEPVNDEHKARWPQHYEAFKKGQELPSTGTPLEQWSVLSNATALNLKALNLRTVENLADAPDAVLQNIHGGFGFKKSAQGFLEQAKGNAPLEKAYSDIEALKARNDVLEGQVRDLAALVQEQADAEGSDEKPAKGRKVAA